MGYLTMHAPPSSETILRELLKRAEREIERLSIQVEELKAINEVLRNALEEDHSEERHCLTCGDDGVLIQSSGILDGEELFDTIQCPDC